MRWPTYSNGVPILPGDWIRVYVARLGVWHHGVVRGLFPVHDAYAVQIVHNVKGTGVTVSDWYAFADGNDVFLHRRPAPQEVQAVTARADANIGKPYHLFAQNCEHFASFAFSGESQSQSVQALGWITAVVVVVAVVSTDNR